MSNIGDLGRPIGGGGAAGYTGNQKPDVTEFSEAGEHGQGLGVSGGHGVPHAGNSQAAAAGFGSGGNGGNDFNGGLGAEHASAGIPGHGQHPIADKFMGQSGDHSASGPVSGAYEGGSTGNALTGQSHASTTGAGVGILGSNTQQNTHSHGLGAGAGAGAGLAAGAVGGAYAGGSANDGLTGESSARTTGAGVGPLGENTQDSSRAAALSSTAGAATAGAGTQSGVGPAGGAGGHYSTDQSQSHSHSGAAGAAGLGAGAGAGAAALSGGRSGEPATNSPLANDGLAKGHFGTTDGDESRGHPVSNPKDLDTGGPYSLVFDEKTGKYLHRHELEGRK